MSTPPTRSGFSSRPDWEPAPYNGLYQACINGGWYREKSVEILTEALDRYDVDGLFFNMFSNPASDYSGRPLGLCHCDNCKRLFRERFGRDLPERPDADYQAFLHDATIDMSETIRKLIETRRPAAALVGTSPDITDMVFSESNTAVKRPLPLWPYASSDNVGRARNTYPQKLAINQCMPFIDFPWRFALVPQAEIRTRLWQNVAGGGPVALNMHGTMDQEARTALEAARPIYAWLKQHQETFVGKRPRRACSCPEAARFSFHGSGVPRHVPHPRRRTHPLRHGGQPGLAWQPRGRSGGGRGRGPERTGAVRAQRRRPADRQWRSRS